MLIDNDHCKPGRPLVILAGWLGCKPKSLRKYRALYNQLGWEVIVKIATPPMVVFAAISDPSPMAGEDILTNELNKSKDRNTVEASKRTMTDLAVDILRQVRATKCPIFMVHVFSNGGCFLWEKIQQILYSPNRNKQRNQNKYNNMDDVNFYPIDDLYKKLVGVVFDSSPAAYWNNPNLLIDAMRFSSLPDRLKLQLYMFARRMTLGEHKQRSALHTRARDYWCEMRNCMSNVRQLYIYSEGDKLTPFGPLDELVHHRQRKLGNDIIHSLQLKDSPHCSHLRIYPKEYTSAIENFLIICSTVSTQSQVISHL